MKENVLITTIFRGNATPIVLRKLEKQGIAIDKIYFLKSQSSGNETEEALNRINVMHEIESEVKEVSQYDMRNIAEESSKLIQDHTESDTYIHVSEGRKTMSFGAMFAAFTNFESVKKILYVTTETSELVQIPKIPLKLSRKKQLVLQLLADDASIDDIEEELSISESTAYNHVKELRDQGYVDSDKNLTPIAEYLLKAK